MREENREFDAMLAAEEEENDMETNWAPTTYPTHENLWREGADRLNEEVENYYKNGSDGDNDDNPRERRGLSPCHSPSIEPLGTEGILEGHLHGAVGANDANDITSNDIGNDDNNSPLPNTENNEDDNNSGNAVNVGNRIPPSSSR